jgi:signal peptidase I
VTSAPVSTEASEETPARKRGGGLFAVFRETVIVIVLALVLSLLIKTFLVQAFSIPSGSMEDTLLVGFDDPNHWLGDLPPENDTGPVQHGIHQALVFVGLLPADSNQHLIKRVIGLPGDHVVWKHDGDGKITVNGKPIDEPYLFPGNAPGDNRDFDVTVPPGRLWVMGDHREDSADSRAHMQDHLGTVPVDKVTGKAFSVVWPFDRFRWL